MDLDQVVQYKALVELSVVGFHLYDPEKRRDVEYTGPQSVWPVFRALPKAIGDWIVDRLRAFHGIEMLPEGEASAGAS
jgi:hypothetical protein